MYINEIEEVFDQILNLLDTHLDNDPVIIKIKGNQTNLLELQHDINSSLNTAIANTSTKYPITAIIKSVSSTSAIKDIFDKQVAFYYFLTIAFYYDPTNSDSGNISTALKEFSNNLVQLSQSQASTTSNWSKQFYKPSNINLLINMFPLIKSIIALLQLNDMQYKAIDPSKSEAKQLLEKYGKRSTIPSAPINLSMFLQQDPNTGTIKPYHTNIVKLIIFNYTYTKQERDYVYQLVTTDDEDDRESIYIDVIVSNYNNITLDYMIKALANYPKLKSSIDMLWRVYNAGNEITWQDIIRSRTNDISRLITLDFTNPINQNFLRFNRDSEITNYDEPIDYKLINTDPTLRSQLFNKQQTKGENTRAKFIVNKFHSIKDFHNDPNSKSPIVQSYFDRGVIGRESVIYNYTDELSVLTKIENQGSHAIETNTYYHELLYIMANAYFTYDAISTDTSGNTTGVFAYYKSPKNGLVIRECNITARDQVPNANLDVHTSPCDEYGFQGLCEKINLTGLTLAPPNGNSIQCLKRDKLVDIRKVTFAYRSFSARNSSSTSQLKHLSQVDDGFQVYYKLVKHLYIKSIKYNTTTSEFQYDTDPILQLQTSTFDPTCIMYWQFNTATDYTISNLDQSNPEFINNMLTHLYRKIRTALITKLKHIITSTTSTKKLTKLPDIYKLMYTFDNLFGIHLDKQTIDGLICEFFLGHLYTPTNLNRFTMSPLILEPISIPTYTSAYLTDVFKITIDMRNPLHVKEYQSIAQFNTATTVTSPSTSTLPSITTISCKHIQDYDAIQRLKKDIIQYNIALSSFLDTYAIETDTGLSCKICGQLLGITRYYIESSGTSQQEDIHFITDYTITNANKPLADEEPYHNYKKSIRFFEIILSAISLATNNRSYLETKSETRRNNKLFIKTLIDFLITHTSTQMDHYIKTTNDEAKIESINDARKLQLDKLYSIPPTRNIMKLMQFNDAIFDVIPDLTSAININNKLKRNCLLVYFILSFIINLTGAHIKELPTTRHINITTFERNEELIFANIRIKTATNSNETNSIRDYPILCYLLYMMAYYITQSKVWYSIDANTNINKQFQINRVLIANSFADAINSATDLSQLNPDLYNYKIVLTKYYQKLHTLFNDATLFNVLKRAAVKATSTPQLEPTDYSATWNRDFSNIDNQELSTQQATPSYGIYYTDMVNALYINKTGITEKDYCVHGCIHFWLPNLKQATGDSDNPDTKLQCYFCNKTMADINPNLDLTKQAFYYNMNKIARLRCIDSNFHEWVFNSTANHYTCNKCHKTSPNPSLLVFTIESFQNVANALRTKNRVLIDLYTDQFYQEINDMYPLETLDNLTAILNTVNDNNGKANYNLKQSFDTAYQSNLNRAQSVIDAIETTTTNIQAQSTTQLSNSYEQQYSSLISTIQAVVGQTNIAFYKHPINLIDKTYIINHTDNTTLHTPLVIDAASKLIDLTFDSFFNTRVYTLLDKANNKTIYYDAVTLLYIGYKQRDKDYVRVHDTSKFIQVNYGILDRLCLLGYSSEYIKIANTPGIENNYIQRKPNTDANKIINIETIARNHFTTVKAIITKFKAIVFKIKKYKTPSSTQAGSTQSLLTQATSDTPFDSLPLDDSELSQLISKYNMTNDSKSFNDDVFEDWNAIKDHWTYEPIVIPASNRNLLDNDVIDFTNINKLDTNTLPLVTYLSSQLVAIINTSQRKEHAVKMVCDIVIYLFNRYNTDRFKNLIIAQVTETDTSVGSDLTDDATDDTDDDDLIDLNYTTDNPSQLTEGLENLDVEDASDLFGEDED